jgi:regulator of protease activity HflC (stomatin/prohibitin superfamily)
MKFCKKKYAVEPGRIGFLFQENKFEKILEPGIYKFRDPSNKISLYTISILPEFKTYISQEVLTKDNIALRFSHAVYYKITDYMKLIEKFDITGRNKPLSDAVSEYIHYITQIAIREKISESISEELNENRNKITEKMNIDLTEKTKEHGITIDYIDLRDLTFPKVIQDLFAKILESKIRARADLENARTQVAAARALKNASEIMKNDESIKQLQYIDTILKIAEKGKHTFIFGDQAGLFKTPGIGK